MSPQECCAAPGQPAKVTGYLNEYATVALVISKGGRFES